MHARILGGDEVSEVHARAAEAAWDAHVDADNEVAAPVADTTSAGTTDSGRTSPHPHRLTPAFQAGAADLVGPLSEVAMHACQHCTGQRLSA